MSELSRLITRIDQLRGNLPDPLDEYDLELSSGIFVGWMDVYPGCKIEIEWKTIPGEEEDFPPLVDTGYIFLLPGQVEPHDTDAIFTEGIVHVPIPAGVEQEANIAEWAMLIDLLNNPQVEWIRLVQ